MSKVNWIVEALVQFSTSPIWKTPVQNFIDDNCHVFIRESEMKFEYTAVHKKFCHLIDTLLTDFLNELGVPMEEAVDSIISFAAENQTPKKDRIVARAQQMLKYIFSMDDFCCFYTLMVKRNIELELMACAELKAIGVINEEPTLESVVRQPVDDEVHAPITREVQQRAIEANGDIDEDEALQRAVQLSMQDAELAEKRVQLEKATAETDQAFTKQKEKERVRVRRSELVAESQGREVTKSRSSTHRHRHLTTTTTTTTTTSAEAEQCEPAVPSAVRAPAVSPPAQAAISASAAVAPPTAAAPPPPAVVAPIATIAIPVVDLAPNHCVSAAQSTVNTSAPPAIAPAATVHDTFSVNPAALPAAPRDIFGQKALPPIAGSDPMNPISGRDGRRRGSLNDGQGQGLDRARHEATSAPESASPEELERRALYMKQQREKIIDMNKSKRQKNLDDYVKQNNVQTVLTKDGNVAAPEQKLTIDIARRLREDILEEARK